MPRTGNYTYLWVFRRGAVSGLRITANAIENVLSGMQFVTKLNRNGYYNSNKLVVNFIQCWSFDMGLNKDHIIGHGTCENCSLTSILIFYSEINGIKI